MSNNYVNSRTAGWRAARGTRDGSNIQMPWYQAMIVDGYGFGIGFGAALNDDTDVGTFGAGGIDFTEHDLLQTLPAAGNTAVIPIFF
jgi:hypothetical protein